MQFAILCTFRPGAAARAKDKRLEHYEFLRREQSGIKEGGPLIGADGIPVAMLIIVDRENLKAAREFISREPYNANGFFEEPVIREWRHVLPEPTPGFVEQEYQKELAARQNAAS